MSQCQYFVNIKNTISGIYLIGMGFFLFFYYCRSLHFCPCKKIILLMYYPEISKLSDSQLLVVCPGSQSKWLGPNRWLFTAFFQLTIEWLQVDQSVVNVQQGCSLVMTILCIKKFESHLKTPVWFWVTLCPWGFAIL